MNKILYKGKTKTTNKWVKGFCIYGDILNNKKSDIEKHDDFYIIDIDNNMKIEPVYYQSVGIYVGELDDGTEIYTGDVLNINGFNGLVEYDYTDKKYITIHKINTTKNNKDYIIFSKITFDELNNNEYKHNIEYVGNNYDLEFITDEELVDKRSDLYNIDLKDMRFTSNGWKFLSKFEKSTLIKLDEIITDLKLYKNNISIYNLPNHTIDEVCIIVRDNGENRMNDVIGIERYEDFTSLTKYKYDKSIPVSIEDTFNDLGNRTYEYNSEVVNDDELLYNKIYEILDYIQPEDNDELFSEIETLELIKSFDKFGEER